MIKTILPTEDNGNVIVTIAIGELYYNQWERFAKKNWEDYCKKNKIGLLVITKDLINKDSIYWKKATWQKFLIGNALKEYDSKIKNVCYLDTDFLINYFSPNVFNIAEFKKINLVSMFKNLPYDLDLIKKRIAFFRHNFYSKKYPLDSSLFMDISDECKYHNKKELPDMGCAGFFTFNIKNHSDVLKSFFFKYKSGVKSLNNNGDQFHFNYEIITNLNVNWLDYKFQALWLYEMSSYFPFLYQEKFNSFELIEKCIQTSLSNNYFLHFAGSWDESNMWLNENINIDYGYDTKAFNRYLKKNIKPRPIGLIKPKIKC